MTNFDEHRLRDIGANHPTLTCAIEALMSGRQDSLAGAPNDDDTRLALREIHVLATRNQGRPAEALQLARDFVVTLERAGRAHSITWGYAQVMVAECGWSVDLRRHYSEVRGALTVLGDSLDPLLAFRSAVLLADLAQCRGEYDVAMDALAEAGERRMSVPPEQASLANTWWASARSRSLLGRRLFDAAQVTIYDAERFAHECDDAAAVVRAGSMAVRLELMEQRFYEARARATTLAEWFDRRSRASFAHWVDLEAEVVFARANVEIFDRAPDRARKLLDCGIGLARSIGSAEAVIEAEVSLAAVALMGDDSKYARQFRAAESATAESIYSDLQEDLKRMTTTKRFAALVKTGKSQ